MTSSEIDELRRRIDEQGDQLGEQRSRLHRVERRGDGIDRLFGHCASYPAQPATPEQRVDYLRARVVKEQARYVNWIGRGERQIRDEARLRERLEQKPDPMTDLLDRLSERLGGAGARPRDYLHWVQASVGSNLRMIPTADILFFRAEDKYTRVQTEGYEALIRKPIKELIEELDPAEFWQIHRSTLVRVDAIAQVSRNLTGKQIVQLKGSDEKLEVSRSFNHLFKQM